MSTFKTNLTPLKNPRPLEAFAVCDIEAANWTRFLVIGFYDGTFFKTFRRIKDFLNFVAHTKQKTIYAHFGGIYDFLFILSNCLEHGFKLDSLIPRGSGILCFTIDFGTHTCTFRDSSALLPFSLRNLTNTFNVETKKGEIDYEKIKKVTPELLAYLRSDCMGLYQVLLRFFQSPLIKRSGAKTTIASQAIQLLRTYIEKPVVSLSPIYDQFVRKGYAGGRTEIYRPFYRGRKNLNCYDVNSLYPSVMQEEFPNACLGFSKTFDLSKMGFIECTVSVPHKTYFPILWVRDEKTRKFLFPVGEFSGVWSTLELSYAQNHGVRILRTSKHLYFSNGGGIFRDFISALFRHRKNSTDETEKTIAKLLLNSSYGRMGLRRDREGLELDSGQNNVTPHFEINIAGKRWRFVKTDVNLTTFSNVAIAAYVTAYARIKMHKLMLKHSKEIYYTDTDSLFTTAKLPTSDNIGDLKLEYSCRSAVFLLPKTYIAGSKVAMKGFDKKKIQHFTFDDFQTALEGDLRKLKITQPQRFARFKTAMRQGKMVMMSKASEKSIKSRYDKRELVFEKKTGKWETRPIVLGNKKEDSKNGNNKKTTDSI